MKKLTSDDSIRQLKEAEAGNLNALEEPVIQAQMISDAYKASEVRIEGRYLTSTIKFLNYLKAKGCTEYQLGYAICIFANTNKLAEDKAKSNTEPRGVAF